MSSHLLRTKSIEQLKAEACRHRRALAEAGARTDQPGDARHRRHHRHGHLRAHRPGGRAVRRAGDRAVDDPRGHRERAGRPVLCRVRVHGADCRLRVHLRLRHARRVLRVGHRLGPDPGIRARRGDGGGGLVRPSGQLRARLPRRGHSRRVVLGPVHPGGGGRMQPRGDHQPAGGAHHAGGHGAHRHRHPRIGAGQHRDRHREGRGRAHRHSRRRGFRERRQLAALHPGEHRHLRPVRMERHLSAARRDLLRLHRLRRRLGGGTGSQEPAEGHADRHPRLARPLHDLLRRWSRA